MRKLHLSLYVVLGWCGLLFLPRMIRENIMLFVFILAGGVIYTLGIIPFALKKKGAHFVWHFFVLFGAIVHWFGIYLYVYGPCN
jgi:hemolysin III